MLVLPCGSYSVLVTFLPVCECTADTLLAKRNLYFPTTFFPLLQGSKAEGQDETVPSDIFKHELRPKTSKLNR